MSNFHYIHDRVTSRTIIIVLIAMISSIIVFLIKANGFPAIENTLWAEDGNIFISEALADGMSAIIKPYAGYLHMWPRIFSIASTIYPLNSTPYILFLGWVMAYMVMSWVIIERLTSHKSSLLPCAICVMLIGLQPTTSETFFTITNAQWYLAIALIVFTLLEGNRKNYAFDYALIVVLSLTGPFSIILAPWILIKILIKKLKIDFLFYGLFFLCSLVQLFFIIKSGRGVSGEIDLNFIHWLESFKIFILFGSTRIFPALCFWALFLLAAIIAIARNRKNESLQGLNFVILTLMASLIYMSGLWTYKQNPLVLSPLGGGARYYVTAYGLIFIACILAFKNNRNILAIFFLAAFTLCIKNFVFYERQDFNFPAYAELSTVVPNVIIPINPASAQYPGWSVVDHRVSQGQIISYNYNYKLDNLTAINGSVIKSNDGNQFNFTGSDPQLVLSEEVTCPNSKYIGIEIAISRSVAGWTQIFWRGNTSYSEAESIRRYYPSGNAKVFFAFPNKLGGTHVRFDPADEALTLDISELKIYCLGKL